MDMESQNNLDPIEKMMIARMANFFITNVNYDLYYNPRDWGKESRFWTNIARMVNGEKYLNHEKFDEGNFNYDPSTGVFELLKSIKINDKSQFPELLNFIIEKLQLVGTKWDNVNGIRKQVKFSHDEKISTLNRYFSVFNLALDSNANIVTSTGMIKQREDDRLLAFGFLNHYPDEKEAFVGAMERFADGGSDAFRQSLTSCRILIENLTKKISGESDWTTALPIVVRSETKKDIIRKIHHYLSAYGPHGSTIPSQHDAELGLKLTEDAIVWLIKNNSNTS